MNEFEMYMYDEKHDFIGIIWPSAEECKDMIFESLKMYASCANLREYCIDKKILWWVMHVAYLYDWIPDDIIQKKHELICSSIKTNNVRIWLISIELKEDNIIFDEKDQRFHSATISEIKRIIRKQYMTQIKNYVHDIIIHISDNYLQTSSLQCAEMILRLINNYSDSIINIVANSNCMNLEIKGNKNSILKYVESWGNDNTTIKVNNNNIKFYLKDYCICSVYFK